MATQARNLFISYARGDRARVAPLVDALTAAGHSVWWDGKLSGGSEFARAIEDALDHADAVIVAWSATSVISGWVRDEAASGRDRQRLVPIQLDATPPPLGFRQTHTIDFSHWNQRANAPEVAALLDGIAGVVDGVIAPPVPVYSRRSRPRSVVGLGVAGWFGWPLVAPGAATAATRIAVMPFENMTGGGDGALFADGIAEEIFDTLARDPHLKVVGRTSAWSFRGKLADPQVIRAKLGVGRLLEGSVRRQADRIRVSVRLIDTADGGEVWGQSFDRGANDAFAVQEEIARAVATRIGGASDAAAAAAEAQSKVAGVYEKVVVARQLIHSRQAAELTRARAMLAEAIAADPTYAPAHATYAFATMLLSSEQYGDIPESIAIAEATTQANVAIALDGGRSGAYAALGRMEESHDPQKRVENFNRAIALRPNDVDALIGVWNLYFYSLDDLRRGRAALERVRQIDPLWPLAVWDSLNLEAAAGDFAAMRETTARFRATTPDPAAADTMEGARAFASGEFAVAIKAVDAALTRNAGMAIASRVRYPAFVSLFAPNTPTTIHTPGESASFRQIVGRRFAAVVADVTAILPATRSEQLTFNLLYSLAVLRRDEDFLRAVATRFGSVTVDQRAAGWDATTTLATAAALARTGRPDDAKLQRDRARANLVRRQASGFDPVFDTWGWTMLLAAEGDRAGALARLETGLRRQWWIVCGGPSYPEDEIAIAGLDREPRARAVAAACRVRIDAERQRAGLGPQPPFPTGH